MARRGRFPYPLVLLAAGAALGGTLLSAWCLLDLSPCAMTLGCGQVSTMLLIAAMILWVTLDL